MKNTDDFIMIQGLVVDALEMLNLEGLPRLWCYLRAITLKQIK